GIAGRSLGFFHEYLTHPVGVFKTVLQSVGTAVVGHILKVAFTKYGSSTGRQMVNVVDDPSRSVLQQCCSMRVWIVEKIVNSGFIRVFHKAIKIIRFISFSLLRCTYHET